MNEVKFPDVHVKLVGEDGNAFAIIGRVSRALRGAGHGDAVKEYTDAATSGDYNNLLRVTMETVSVDSSDDDEDW
jgi:hypothetical protein